MNPFQVKTLASFEGYLTAIGFTKTVEETDTSNFWKSNQNGKHVQVPKDVDGFYPDFLMRLVLEQVVAIGHVPMTNGFPMSGLGQQ